MPPSRIGKQLLLTFGESSKLDEDSNNKKDMEIITYICWRKTSCKYNFNEKINTVAHHE